MGADEIDLRDESEKSAPDVYLLDTSTLLWLIMEPRRLSEAAKAIWQNPKKLVAVSVVSYWEVAIKAQKKIFQIEDVAKWWDRRVLPYIDLETLPIREDHVSESGCRTYTKIR